MYAVHNAASQCCMGRILENTDYMIHTERTRLFDPKRYDSFVDAGSDMRGSMSHIAPNPCGYRILASAAHAWRLVEAFHMSCHNCHRCHSLSDIHRYSEV